MKFFLFRREAVSVFSDIKSNTGDGISVLGVPADRIANLTATKGQVRITFNDSGLYDNFTGRDREGLEKVHVSVGCIEGEEYNLIRDIMEFISSDSKKNIMEMDAVSESSTFKRVLAENPVVSYVPSLPVVAGTGLISSNPASTDLTETVTNTFAGISFASHTLCPIVDFNETTLTSSIGANVGGTNTWANAGRGGNAYVLDADTGNPLHSRARINNLATDAVTIAAGDLLHFSNTLTVSGDYTMYIVYNTLAVVDMYSIYSDAGAQTKGFGIGTVEDKVYFSFDGNTGRPCSGETNNTSNSTVAAKLQDPKVDDLSVVGAASSGAQLCYVMVIRRDKDFNIYVHNHTGEVISFIPAVVGGLSSKDFRTDGDLVIDRLGGDATSGAPSDTWKGDIARFGVIESDIGTSEASRIAKELFDRYNYYPF